MSFLLQGIEDNADGTSCHGRGRQQRVDPAHHRQRNGEGVVTKGEAEVLQNRPVGNPGKTDQFRDPFQLGTGEQHVGGIEGDFACIVNRGARIRLAQGGGIIDSIPDHHHHFPGCLKLFQVTKLHVRKHRSMGVFDVQRTFQGLVGNRIWPPLHALRVDSLNVFPS